MRAQIVANVVPISIAPTPSLLNHNNIEITYAWTSNFIMEPVRSTPLYFVAMPQSMITITKAPFVSTLIQIVVGIRSKPQTPRGTIFMNLHEDMPKKVNKIFTNQPLDPKRGDSNPPRPPRYFGLPMVNPSRPPLPPNIISHLTILNMSRIQTQMFMLEFLKLPLKQIVK